MKFRIINKSDSVVRTYSNPDDIGLYLSGRRIDNYFVIKSDALGDRLIPLPRSNPDYRNIVDVLRNS